MIGNRQRPHSQFLGVIHQIVNFRQSVKKGIMTVSMKMNEFRHNFFQQETYI